MTTGENGIEPITDSSGSGFIVGAVIIVGLVVALIYIGFPTLRQVDGAEFSVPTTEVSVPDTAEVILSQAEKLTGKLFYELT